MNDFFIKQITQEQFFSHYPKILYKYRDWENNYHRKIITNKEIYLPCFNELNDEFDGKQPYRYNTNISFDDYKKALKKNDKCEYQKLSDENLKQMYYNLQSGHDWKGSYEDHIENVNRLYGVYSLSNTNTNQQLWANYANSNKGFCIGFDTKNLFNTIKGYDEELTKKYGIDIEAIAKENNIKGRLQDKFLPTIGFVTYEDNPVLMNLDEQDNIYQYQNLFFTKQKKWEYEEEVRLLKTFASKKTFEINNTTIREIIFGIKMQKQHKEDIITEVQKSGFQNVTFYDVVKNMSTLKFEIKKITI